MFTGLIQELGTIKTISPLNEGAKWEISVSEKFVKDCELGDSICINGVCSTVTSIADHTLSFDYLPETLKRTTFNTLKAGSLINLEKSLTPTSKMGGHFVTGHIDETVRIGSLIEGDPFWEISCEFKSENRKFLVEKGSVCLDGISLTVGNLNNSSFTCYLIPHTISHTNLKQKKVGDLLNIEYDMLGKYVLNQIIK